MVFLSGDDGPIIRVVLVRIVIGKPQMRREHVQVMTAVPSHTQTRVYVRPTFRRVPPACAWRREYSEQRSKKALAGLTPTAYAEQLNEKALLSNPDSRSNCY